MAEQNLKGCYDKRRLEAARFMWSDAAQLMMKSEWEAATKMLQLAAAKKEGWGWAVNYGDIWLAEAVARLIHGAELAQHGNEEPGWLAKVAELLDKCVERSEESGVFGAAGHPWASEVSAALDAYNGEGDNAEWLEALKSRTIYWCAHILSGAAPFPPKLRPRHEDAAALLERLPGHND